VDSFSKTIANMEETLKNTQTQLNNAREIEIKYKKELSEITASLYEKIVQLEALDAKTRRALEQKQELEDKLTKIASTPAEPVTATPVTQEKTNVVSAGPLPSSVDLKGLITELNESMATLSLGTADGVKKDMVFHVTRGDAFICDIVITSIDVNKSAGVVELKQKEPKVGDTASTKL
jgi:cell shape-determining protein MreC